MKKGTMTAMLLIVLCSVLKICSLVAFFTYNIGAHHRQSITQNK
ncbi:MAG: hypothetical protein WD055_02280 [Candidatus Dependentiae bacterium]